MAISQELEDRIEKEIADLTARCYLRAGMAYNRFVKELTKLIAQANKEKDRLINTKFNPEELSFYG